MASKAVANYGRILLQWNPSCELLPSIRHLSCHRASITKVGRPTFTRTYPTVLVLPDGATISVRYPVPRQIIKLPINMETASKEDIRRVKRLRRPREKVDSHEEITSTFDPLKYLNQ